MYGQPMLITKHRRILEHLSKGKSFDEVMMAMPGISIFDIANAAAVALAFVEIMAAECLPDDTPAVAKRPGRSSKRSRGQYPRAGKTWEPGEIASLRADFAIGAPLQQVAERLGRKPSAVAGKLEQLGLLHLNESYEAAQRRHREGAPKPR